MGCATAQQAPQSTAEAHSKQHKKRGGSKRKKGSGYSIKIGFHVDFKFTFDGKFVKVTDYFNWTIENTTLSLESILKKIPEVTDHIPTKEELEVDAVISIVKARILEKTIERKKLEERLNINRPDYL